jgi:diguanylate cyclase (GGDEF)-like protein
MELNDRHERRDVVARALRTVLADELSVHPRILGGLSPVGGARFLSHLTAARKSLSRLQAQMAVDELTGALRRAAGEGRLEQEIRRANRLAGGQLTIAFVDVDSLKTVNDSAGHAAGDRLLQTLVTSVRARLRSYDTVVRWGGDEFVCIMPQTDPQAADKVFSEILDGFKERTGQQFSIGIASLQEGDSMSDVVERADRHLYERKRRANEEAPPPTQPAPQPQKRGFGSRFARLLRGG